MKKLRYFRYTYDEDKRDYIKEEMSRSEVREFLTRYYYDNEILDMMIDEPNPCIRTMFGYVEVVEAEDD